jgi:hypothetical protein
MNDRDPNSPRPRARRPIDWAGWIALAWALAFGLLYARMIVEQKAPRLLSLVRYATRR